MGERCPHSDAARSSIRRCRAVFAAWHPRLEHLPWRSLRRITHPVPLRQLAFSNRAAPKDYRFTIYMNLWPGRTPSRFRQVHGNAPYAEVRIFCGLTGAASWSGQSCFSCSCGRSAAANAAQGIWLFSFASADRSKSVQPSPNPSKNNAPRVAISSARMRLVKDLQQLANRGMRIPLRG